MNELLLYLLTVLMSVIAWIGRDHIKRLRTLEAEAVRKADLDKLRIDIQEDRQRMHEENKEQLNRIDATVTSTHRRIDELYRLGMK